MEFRDISGILSSKSAWRKMSVGYSNKKSLVFLSEAYRRAGEHEPADRAFAEYHC
jgi:hypothetical protein